MASHGSPTRNAISPTAPSETAHSVTADSPYAAPAATPAPRSPVRRATARYAESPARRGADATITHESVRGFPRVRRLPRASGMRAGLAPPGAPKPPGLVSSENRFIISVALSGNVGRDPPSRGEANTTSRKATRARSTPTVNATAPGCVERRPPMRSDSETSSTSSVSSSRLRSARRGNRAVDAWPAHRRRRVNAGAISLVSSRSRTRRTDWARRRLRIVPGARIAAHPQAAAT